ncbi:glycosyltransferase [Paenibacillus kobensis]|uniref:glycosyltransferase n=1 Tax=Paenibacillus kobensis TaxID=59841 RepID=UPI000FD9BAAA|nr:glycosyltransferase [Paenibacillus kobensis]
MSDREEEKPQPDAEEASASSDQTETSNPESSSAALPTSSPQFYELGEGTVIEAGSMMQNAEEISIGRGVFVRSGAWFNICTPVTGERPKLIVGDGCQFNFRVSVSAANRIVLERFSTYGHQTYISDTNHEYRNIGIPVVMQGITDTDGETIVGEGTWVGANCSICGPLRIGRGSVIGANSVVTRNIPDYSVAVGAPARVVKMFDTDAADWIAVRRSEEIETVLRRRREHPVMTICIPTYNRATDLARCLGTIFHQIGECTLIEVLVSDNASPDQTQDVLKSYAEAYPNANFRYWRNEENIGAERNILKLMDEARGDYVMLHGDDDFFVDMTIMPLFNIVHRNRNSSVIFIDVLNNSHAVETFEGLDAFIRKASIHSGFISSIIIERDLYRQIEDKSLFIGSGFNHIYLQLEAVRRKPQFTVVNESVFAYAGNKPDGYNFAKYFIEGYLSILSHNRQFGLSEEAIKHEKGSMLATTVLPWYKRIVEEELGSDLTGFEEIYTAHYKDEPYYEQILEWIRGIQPSQPKDSQ